MGHILEISQQGDLQIPSDLLPSVKRYKQYHLEVDGETIILRPQKSDSFWATATPAQRAARFRHWAAETKRPTAPPLPDEAVSRDTIYD